MQNARQRHVYIEHHLQDYLRYNGHRRHEIAMITKLRARASTLRSDLKLRHLLPETEEAKCRHCGQEEETIEHVANDCSHTQREREVFRASIDK